MATKWTIESSAVGRILVPPPDDGVALFYTTRDFDGMLTDDSVEKLLAALRARFGIDSVLATCSQVHGVGLAAAPREARRWCESAGCDALWSDRENVALGIKVADCLPVTVADQRKRVIANIHAGWRGASRNVVGRTIDRIVSDAAFVPAGARAWLGPSIRVCCFEVGEEVVEQFAAQYPWTGEYVDRTRGERPHVDLPGIATRDLVERGFAPESILDSDACTRCNGSLFHSYRRDGTKSGRNLAIVAQ
jgi:polyphenol oxidase